MKTFTFKFDAHYRNEDDSGAGESHSIEFTIFFWGQACNELTPTSDDVIGTLLISMNSESPTQINIPTLSDPHNMLTSPKCAGLQYEVTIDGQVVDFLTISDDVIDQITLTAPTLAQKDWVSAVPHQAKFRVLVPEQIYEQSFFVLISGPDCTAIEPLFSGVP